MAHTGISMEPATDHLLVAYKDSTNERVGTGLPGALTRELQSFANIDWIHCSNKDWMYFSASNGSKSSTFSPTPTYRIGRLSSRAMATTTPPLAVPSSLASTMP